MSEFSLARPGMPAAFVAQRGASLPNGHVSTGTTNAPFAWTLTMC